MKPLKMVFFIVLFLFVVGIGGVFFFYKFEGETPSLHFTTDPSFVGKQTTLTIVCNDRRSGVKEIRVELIQGNRSVPVFHETYPPGTHGIEKPIVITPISLGFKDGTALLRAEGRDYSWRPRGNNIILEIPITIDTLPPSVSVLSRLHYINRGGAALIVYQASEKLVRSGVKVGDLWFPGYKVTQTGFLSFFAVPFDATDSPPITLVSEDLAGNLSRNTFHYRTKLKKFRHDTVSISDSFLNKVMPYFMDRDPSLRGDLLDVFLKVNRDLRKASNKKIQELCRKTESQPLWSGSFLRMVGAKKMAGFADHRVYTYKGKKIDRQYHLGIDLASTVMSPVKAANRGKVVFTGELGIYGNTIILDHGCGLFSLYAHLNQIDVQVGQIVEKGQPIGITGTTGLAGGNHLHFSILVSGVFVNPTEWWDPHWIKDNVDKKLALLRSTGR